MTQQICYIDKSRWEDDGGAVLASNAPRGYIEALQRRHKWLHEQVDDEQSRPLPDTIRLTALKRQKLALKQKIHRLSAT